MPHRANVLAHVSHNLRHYRAASGFSQAALAEASGISRRMIVNLEGGDTNISLASLDRLAAALDVTFVDMVADPHGHDPAALDVLAWRGRHQASEGRLLTSVPASTEAQLWTWSLGPGDRYDAEPDPPGWTETLLVVTGRLRLRLADDAVELGPGEYTTFSSSQTYAYVNIADDVTVFSRILVC